MGEWGINNSTVLGIVAGAVLALLVRKVWEDLIPKRQIFTLPRLIGALIAGVGIIAIWQLAKVAAGDEPITALMMQAFLTNMGITVWVGAALLVVIYRQHKRLQAIERHCGISTGQ